MQFYTLSFWRQCAWQIGSVLAERVWQGDSEVGSSVIGYIRLHGWVSAGVQLCPGQPFGPFFNTMLSMTRVSIQQAQSTLFGGGRATACYTVKGSMTLDPQRLLSSWETMKSAERKIHHHFSHQEGLSWQFHAFHCPANAFCFSAVFFSIVHCASFRHTSKLRVCP